MAQPHAGAGPSALRPPNGGIPVPRDPVLIGVLIVAAASVGWCGSGFWLPGGRASDVSAVVALVGIYGLADIVAAVLGYQVARALPPGHSARRFWRVWCVASILYAAGAGSSVWVIVASGQAGNQSPAPALFVSLGVTITAGVLLSYPTGVRSRRERVRLWLDLATVMAGALGFGGYAVLSAADADRVRGNQGPGVTVAPVLTACVILLVILFVTAKLMISGSAPFTFQTGVIAAAASALAAVLQGLGPLMLARGQAGIWFTLTFLVHMALLAAAAVQRRQVLADPQVLTGGTPRPYSALPYLAIAATYGLLIVTLNLDGLHRRSWMVVGAAVGSTVLVIARQLAAFADNARLLAERDATVAERDATVDELRQAKTVLQAALAERDALTDQLRNLAFRDSLTGLANRALMLEHLDHATSRARRDGGLVAVMLIDLDDFKPVNDTFGHAAGDAVLQVVADRLRAAVREADTPARLGGDEFAIVLDDPEPDTIVTIAERIVAAISEPIDAGGQQIGVSASVGVAHDHSGRTPSAQLLHAADLAMYDAKRRGKGTYEISNINSGSTSLPADAAVLAATPRRNS